MSIAIANAQKCDRYMLYRIIMRLEPSSSSLKSCYWGQLAFQRDPLKI